MKGMNHKQGGVIVDGVDKEGADISIRVSFTNDWQGNLDKLNKKIRKKLRTQNEYALSVNGMTIRYDDVQGLADVMNQIDSNEKPRFTIVDISVCGPGYTLENDLKMDDIQIFVHYNDHKVFVFNVSDELNDDTYKDLLDGISQHFKIKIENQSKYKMTDDEQCTIDDFDDFEAIIDEKQNEDSIHLYVLDKIIHKKAPRIRDDQKDPSVHDPMSENDFCDGNEYPVMPLIMPDNCYYNPQTDTMNVYHNKPRRTLVPYQPALDFIRSIKQRISTVSIVGKARTGKSMVAGELYAPKRIPCPFDLGNLMDACTYGIWVSAKPIPHPTKDDTVMLILDVEGTGFHGNTKNHDTQLMVVALLISSYFIYNSKGSFDASCLEEIRFITDLADRIKTTPDDDSDGEDLQYILPIFMWLLRDVHLTPTINGKTVDVRRYFQETVLKYDRGKTTEKRRQQEIRDVFQDIFQKYDAFTLDIPHSDQRILQQLGNIPRYKLEPAFNRGLNKFCAKVKREAGVKMLFSKTNEGKNEYMGCTGPLLAGLIEEVLKAVNDPNKIPVISSMTQNIMISHYRKAATKAMTEYTNDFNICLTVLRDNTAKTPLNEIDITEAHYQCFNKILNGSAKCLRSQSEDDEKTAINKVDIHQRKSYQMLCDRIGHNDEDSSKIGKINGSLLCTIFSKNRELSRDYANEFIHSYFEQNIEEMLSDPQNYEAQDILDAIDRMESDFFSKCKGEVKAKCWNSFKSNKLKQSMKYFKNSKGFSQELLKVQTQAAEDREKDRTEIRAQEQTLQRQQQELEQQKTQFLQMQNKFDLESSEHQKQLALTQERMKSLQQTNTANERKNKQLIDSYKSQVTKMQTDIANSKKTQDASLKKIKDELNKNVATLQTKLKEREKEIKERQAAYSGHGHGMYPYGYYPYGARFTFNYTNTTYCQITEGGTRMRSLGKGCPYVGVSTSYGWATGIHTWAIRNIGNRYDYSLAAVITNYSAVTSNGHLPSHGLIASTGGFKPNETVVVTLDLINWKVVFHKNGAHVTTVNIATKNQTYYRLCNFVDVPVMITNCCGDVEYISDTLIISCID